MMDSNQGPDKGMGGGAMPRGGIFCEKKE